jgi:hypothetical protein
VTVVKNKSGAISTASFDSDIGAAIGDTLSAGNAVVLAATGGDLAGHTFLIGLADGDNVYNAGSD